MQIGKIVKSESHITYVCHVYAAHEVEIAPSPADYAFGRFVRAAVRSRPEAPLSTCEQEGGQAASVDVVGVIFDTILQNPAFGQLGPQLSNETQVELFSPDYVAEKAVLVYVMVLGMMERRRAASGEEALIEASHGVPLLALELGSEMETMTDEEVYAFHSFSAGNQSGQRSSLHMGYLPHIIAQRNSLLPMVTLRIIDQLERLFPQHCALLSIVKRNFAWRLKVEPTG